VGGAGKRCNVWAVAFQVLMQSSLMYAVVVATAQVITVYFEV
jgi:hypothetical protein